MLGIIMASTRPNRVGQPVAQWINAEAVSHGGFDEVALINLLEQDLPFMNEPHDPRLRKRFSRYLTCENHQRI